MFRIPTGRPAARLLAALLATAAFGAHAAPVNVQILSATVKDRRIDGATVTLQRNGEQSVSGVTNAQGQVALTSAFADDAGALLIVKKAGYSNLVVKCPCADMTYAISPVMNNLDGLRVVLNWGARPEDLDSHVVFPGNHVYFESMRGADAMLDVDDTDGFGPETITLNRRHVGERYVYAVHDYTDRADPRTPRLSRSSAKVFVYVGQTLVKTYYVPLQQTGNLWIVFAITPEGEIQDLNRITSVVSERRLQGPEFQGVMDAPASTAPAATGTDGSADAQALNSRGETAYRAGNLDEAITLYQQAIEIDASYGQAYSNLGLAFQKAGRVAEAMWANRKAIALADGPTAARVRASSRYNNGRIYEDAGQWDDAAREYRAARAEAANPVYDKAIERMRQKGAR
ncbi:MULTISPECIES: tetratricopeptide repeat protein [Derxia]|uniref:Tetratricopeptide repeat protein n=1 Tax=Derxia gummosa DSM 723 TaxID=1121388 RepID=A0A9U5CZW5_9BURK|nr:MULTISPECIES: tetratricopeptide repeat protein [Derxia]